MSDNSKIEWTDATWNPITGCSVVSPGCTNCYAMRLAGTRFAHLPSRAGLTDDSKAGPVWNGQVRFNEQWLTQPLQWKRPRRIFVCAHGDLFHENVPDEWIDKVFAVMALAAQRTFQVLTKRSKRMREYMTRPGVSVRVGLEATEMTLNAITANPRRKIGEGFRIFKAAASPGALKIWPLPNVWLGVTTEDQARADERIPDLLATPAAVRFVSAEPLLGPIDFRRISYGTSTGAVFGHPNITKIEVTVDALKGAPITGIPGLDWIIVGGESGKGARPMHPDWARSIRDQCKAAGAAFFFKQWGEWEQVIHVDQRDGARLLNLTPGKSEIILKAAVGDVPINMRRVGKARAGRLLDGVTHDEFPEART